MYSFLHNGMFISSFENAQILSFSSKLPLINSSGTSHIGEHYG